MALSHAGRIDLGSVSGRAGDDGQLVDADVHLAVEPAGRDEETDEPAVRLVARAPLPANRDRRMEAVLTESEAEELRAALSESFEDA